MNLNDSHFKKTHNSNHRFLSLKSEALGADWMEKSQQIDELIEHLKSCQKQNLNYYIYFFEGDYYISRSITGFFSEVDHWKCIDQGQGECFDISLTDLVDNPEVFASQKIKALFKEVKTYYLAQKKSLKNEWQWIVSEGIDKDGVVVLKWSLRVFTEN